MLYGGAGNFCQSFCGLKLWILESFNLWRHKRKPGPKNEFKSIRNQEKDDSSSHIESTLSIEEQASDGTIKLGHG